MWVAFAIFTGSRKSIGMWVFAPAEQHVYSIESYQVPHSDEDKKITWVIWI